MEVPKIMKRDPFFQSKTSIFHDEETPFTSFPGANKARMKLLQSPKSTMVTNKTKVMTDKHTHTQTAKIRSDQHIQKFKFQIQIAQSAHEVVSGAKKITPRLR
jgi:hypothetical protein